MSYVVVVSFQISQHYSKPRVTPVEILPVFPDFKVSQLLNKNNFTQFIVVFILIMLKLFLSVYGILTEKLTL